MRNEKLYLGVKHMLGFLPNEALLTRKQVAALFCVSTQTIIRLQIAGKLPAVRIGAASVRYKRSDVEKLIADSMKGTA
jgi:excisionase family DNA binding protein